MNTAASIGSVLSLCTHSAYTLVTLDDCKFHECVDLTEFERDRVIVIHPPDGEVRAYVYVFVGGTYGS